MVEGLFAGYKLHHDAKWKGEYLVYDRLSYENWTGKYEPPAHVTKEIYIPGQAADSRDAASVHQFPVKDGDWVSKAVGENRYVRNRHGKKKKSDMPNDAKPANPGQLELPHLQRAAVDDSYTTPTAPKPGDLELSGAQPDMFVEALKKIQSQRQYMDRGEIGSAGASADDSDPSSADTSAPQDHWVRRGEYIIRVHVQPRSTLFSPSQWLHEI